ncbi:hypothetical protein [Xanthomonas campestris]|uniref:hypothetical protein n=1 Tax=Xanthomonas campestris TaxID=339 RepID=UPI0012907C34|nr:hypothetical protein [Xanthomonas campestris]MEA9833009.1 hypothetical protein [Xanthomonas campestris pv. raphani]MEA9950865.1 hypothetical protein [Xanthomonas campestris pv. raphani]MEA9953473.1 hypothetical protein [Xanthomonas campestris pv. raphani]
MTTKQDLSIIFNCLSFVFAAVAAFLWYRSTTAKVPHYDGDPGTGNPEIIVDGLKYIETSKLQVKWNRLAAGVSGAAALSQALGMLFTTLAAA